MLRDRRQGWARFAEIDAKRSGSPGVWRTAGLRRLGGEARRGPSGHPDRRGPSGHPDSKRRGGHQGRWPPLFMWGSAPSAGGGDGEADLGGGLTEGRGGAGVVDEVAERGGAVEVDDGLGGGVGLAVERAEVRAVGFQAEGAGGDAVDFGDGADDVEEGDAFGGTAEFVPAAHAALAGDEPGGGELLEDLGEVVGGDLGLLGQGHGGDEAVGAQGEPGHGPHRIFGGL